MCQPHQVNQSRNQYFLLVLDLSYVFPLIAFGNGSYLSLSRSYSLLFTVCVTANGVLAMVGEMALLQRHLESLSIKHSLKTCNGMRE